MYPELKAYVRSLLQGKTLDKETLDAVRESCIEYLRQNNITLTPAECDRMLQSLLVELGHSGKVE